MTDHTTITALAAKIAMLRMTDHTTITALAAKIAMLETAYVVTPMFMVWRIRMDTPLILGLVFSACCVGASVYLFLVRIPAIRRARALGSVDADGERDVPITAEPAQPAIPEATAPWQPIGEWLRPPTPNGPLPPLRRSERDAAIRLLMD